MARFAVYAGIGRGEGFVVDVQASLLDELSTGVVIPLLPADSGRIIRDLNPAVEIDGRPFVVMTQELSAVPRALLKRSVGSLDAWRDEIVRALDILLTGL
jgi:toxin CcdB